MTSVATDRRQGVNAGIAIKVAVAAASIANLTLSGEQTVDGVALITTTPATRVLVKNQTVPAENGIYDVDSGNWSRSVDFDGTFDIATGTLVLVTGGTLNSNVVYAVTTANPITIGTTGLTFAAAGLLSSPILLTTDGTVGAPALSWASDPDTGIYRIGANNIGVAVGGAKVLDIGAGALGVVNGTLALPALSFISDPDTGAYRSGANQFSIGAGGVLVCTFGPNFGTPDGAVGTPGHTFNSDADTGMWRPGTNILAFSAGGVEPARFNALAYSKFSNAGTYQSSTAATHEFNGNTDAANALLSLKNSAATATNQYGLAITLAGDPNDATRYFLQCLGNATPRCNILSTGNIVNTNNSYGAISDAKLKEGVKAAGSQWADVKALAAALSKYTLIDDPSKKVMLGLVAQDVLPISPGLVFETEDQRQVEFDVQREVEVPTGLLDVLERPIVRVDKVTETQTRMEPTGDTTLGVQYSLLYLKAVGALGEVMTRLEQIEADFAAYKAAHP